MDYCILIAKSLTHAQRMVRLLAQCGIRATAFRAGSSLTQRGCGYAVRIRADRWDEAQRCLDRAELHPLDVVWRKGES